MRLILVYLALLCLTVAQLKDAQCDVLCTSDRLHFYAGGMHKNGRCICSADMGLLSDYREGQVKVQRFDVYDKPEPVATTRSSDGWP